MGRESQKLQNSSYYLSPEDVMYSIVTAVYCTVLHICSCQKSKSHHKKKILCPCMVNDLTRLIVIISQYIQISNP